MKVPTLFEWMGGMPALEKLFDVFYARVPRDPLLAPVFAEITPEHSKHVAAFVAEVLGGVPLGARLLSGMGNAPGGDQFQAWRCARRECADASVGMG